MNLLALIYVGSISHHVGGPDRREQQSEAGKELMALVAGTGSFRPLEAQLTLPLDHVPCHGAFGRNRSILSPRRCSEMTVALSRGVRKAIRKRRAAEPSNSSSICCENQHFLGLAYLLSSHQAGRLEKAIETLDRARSDCKGNPGVLSDLAAARFSLGQRTDDVAQLLAALSLIDEALAIDPSLPAAQFNKALVLDALSLADAAREAWVSYLALDPPLGWASEAEDRLRASGNYQNLSDNWNGQLQILDSATRPPSPYLDSIVERFPLRTYEYVLHDLMVRWAEAWSAENRGRAEEILQTADRLATAIARVLGDQLAVTVVAAVKETRDTGPLDLLAQGHLAYETGLQAYASGELRSARHSLRKAVSLFDQGQTPMWAWAVFYLAVCEYLQLELEEAIDRLRSVVVSLPRGDYPVVEGRIEWMIGMAQLAGGDPAASLASYRRSAVLFRAAGVVEYSASVDTLIGENLAYLGERKSSWHHHLQALSAIPEIVSLRRIRNSVDAVAFAAFEDGYLRASHLMFDESVALAKLAEGPETIAHALLSRGEVRLALGDFSGAVSDFEAARASIFEVPDVEVRHRLLADLALVQGEALSRIDPSKAVRFLNYALKYFDQTSNRFSLARIYLALMRSHQELGFGVEGRQLLLRGIEEYERQRRTVNDPALGAAFSNEVRELFDAMIEILAPNFEEAFQFAERARAMGLGAKATSVSPARFTSDEIRRHLPDKTILLEFVSLEESLFVWAIRNHSVSFQIIPASRQDLESLIVEFDADLQQGRADGASTAGQRLYQLLLGPVLSAEDAEAELLLLVLDKSLHGIPFAALHNETTERFLFEDFAHAILPSASFLVGAEAAGVRLRDPSVLVVSEPLLDRRQGPHLSPLPGAREEGGALVEVYPGARLLLGGDATKTAVVESIVSHEILHFGGHSVSNTDFPMLSYLALSSEDPIQSGYLYSREIYGLDLQNVELAVLAACRTASGPERGSEGVLSIGQAFLAAGVASVVASRWDVADRAGSRFSRRFHGHVRSGQSVAEALRSTRLEFSSSPDPILREPRQWANFTLLGSPF